MTLYVMLTIAGIYLGLSAAHTFALVGNEVFYVCTLICGILFATAEVTK